MQIGIDIVKIERMASLISDKEATRKVFQEAEICDDAETMAGFFAAKEAYFKAKGKKDDWLTIEIKKNNYGRPIISTADKDNVHLSISHDGDYAIAMVIIK